MKFLIAYDIASPQRLRRVARVLERDGIRCQKSVFIVSGSLDFVQRLLDEIEVLISVRHDIVQAWQLANGGPAEGVYRGSATEVTPTAVIADDSCQRTISKKQYWRSR